MNLTRMRLTSETILGALELMEFPVGNRRMCPVCDGFNVSAAGATPRVHTASCPVPAILARVRALQARGEFLPEQRKSKCLGTAVYTPEQRKPVHVSQKDNAPEHATRGQLVTRGIKAAGGYPAPKGFKVIGYDYTVPKTTGSLVTMRTGYTVRVQVSRVGAHHLSGRVYSKLIARGETLDIALAKAIAKIGKMRAGMKD